MSDLFAGLSLSPSVSSSSPTKPAVKSPTNTTLQQQGDDSQFDEFLTNFASSSPSSPSHGIGMNGTATKTTTTRTTSSSSALPSDSESTILTTAPATEKFLGLLGTPPSSPQRFTSSTTPTATTTPTTSPPVAVVVPSSLPKSPTIGSPPTIRREPPVTPSLSPGPKSPGGGSSSSLVVGASTSSAVSLTEPSASASTGEKQKDVPPLSPSAADRNKEATDEVLTAFSIDSQHTTMTNHLTDPSEGNGPATMNGTSTLLTPSNKVTTTSSSSATTSNDASPRIKPSLRGMGTVLAPGVPHPEVTLRLFQKFASKVQDTIPESHGGTFRKSLFGYLFGSSSNAMHDAKYDAYKSWSEAVTAEKDADKAIASFCHLVGVWSNASSHMAEVESKTSVSYQQMGQNLSHALDTVTALVSRGCLDGVEIQMMEDDRRPKMAVSILCEAVFACDTTHTRVELSAMKFLLSTGCRVYGTSPSSSSTNGGGQRPPQKQQQQRALLRGTYLLQSIRVLYHVYLTTVSNANKTTARASLQQLVTSVFIRMIAASSKLDEHDNDPQHHQQGEAVPPPPPPPRHEVSTGGSIGEEVPKSSADFPTEAHRDAFLVLRSLCKLSMRNPPSNMHSHVGFQAGNSNMTWDAQNTTTATPTRTPASPSIQSKKSSSSGGGGGSIGTGESSSHGRSDGPSLLLTQAIHPALESKILALDLLLYVLQNTDMKGDFFIQRSGTQFHNAIRSYLCVSLLKNCTSDDTRVVSLSLRVFVPIIRNFRSLLKTEIEAFVTNVFFVILDSKNSPMEHKNLVVTLFEEICSDPQTLAEIFLNYDCDLSAVDLFHRMVNTLAKVARSMELQTESNSILGSGTVRMEKARSSHRQLRLEAMKALRQVLASLHGSIVKPMPGRERSDSKDITAALEGEKQEETEKTKKTNNLVEIYGSKKKRQEEESEIILRFNQKPSAGLAYAAKCGHVDGTDPDDVARFLLTNKDKFEKTEIGEYLGREPDYQNGFVVKVLHGYLNALDFEGLAFDDAIRHYLSGFRLPGEAQKIDRIMEKFAERFTAQNPDVFPSADVAFILAFSIIMLNTDLHNPAIKEERRMTKDGFIRNNRGICDGQDLPNEMLLDIFDRIKSNPISLKEDDEAREKAGKDGASSTGLPSAMSPAAFFTNYDEADRAKESNFNKERDQIVKTTESLLRRKRHGHLDGGKNGRKSVTNGHAARPHHQIRYVRTEDSGLRDEYVSPMFEVTWGPALAAFSTAMESANGTVGALLAIATDEELEAAAMNAAETIEVCLAGFRFAICTAGLCGNDVARDAYMLALARFSQLGTGTLLEQRHIRCAQTMLTLARYNGELLGRSWEHAFRAMSEINRFHQLFQLLARNDKAIALAAKRRKARLEEREQRLRARKARRAAKEKNDADDSSLGDSAGDLSFYDDSDLFSDGSDQDFSENMNTKEIDEANARTVYEAVSEALIEAIYERSSSLSTATVKEFIHQLCRVSRMEISGNWQAGADSDLSSLLRGQRPTPVGEVEGFHHHQTNIYSLQKLVEVTHYNMDSRPRLVFAEIWTPVSEHLTTTALHSNPAVAMHAVDSVRQLSIQFLQREELGAFEFQRRFLKPLEVVMSRSQEHTTKELLLKCVERLILMFGHPSEEQGRHGMLRSGWRPILTVLGLAGRDKDQAIAKLGFSMLSAQLLPAIGHEKGETDGRGKSRHGFLLDERFVEVVDALLIYVDGPHEELSIKSLEHLLTLSSYLADDSFALPLIKKRGATPKSMTTDEGGVEGSQGPENQELELWWPILLGISRAIGDDRKNIRVKSLDTLSKVIMTHLFPTPACLEDDKKRGRQVQLLQLIFRGILMPVLEFAEIEVSGARPPALPSDFDRFLTGQKNGDVKPVSQKSQESWIDTTFDQFMDACIHICLKAGEAFGDDILLEEVFAMLNSCMISDSGALAVRGLRRLELLLTGDLKANEINDDLWATVSHMLRRSLAVRSLPKPPSGNSNSPDTDGLVDEAEKERQESIREFLMEDSILANRRYIGSNAVMVIASFLGSERFLTSLGLRWRLFMVSGVGRAIRDWEYASSLVDGNTSKTKQPIGTEPPSYMETAFYSRKHMNRFLLQIMAKKEIASLAAEGSREASAQAVVKEQTQNLVSTFLKKEALIASGKASTLNVKLFERWTGLLRDMFAAYDMIPEEQLSLMSWLDPAIMPCITTNTESIRLAVGRLTKKLHPIPQTVNPNTGSTSSSPQDESPSSTPIPSEDPAMTKSTEEGAESPSAEPLTTEPVSVATVNRVSMDPPEGA